MTVVGIARLWFQVRFPNCWSIRIAMDIDLFRDNWLSILWLFDIFISTEGAFIHETSDSSVNKRHETTTDYRELCEHTPSFTSNMHEKESDIIVKKKHIYTIQSTQPWDK